MKIEPKIEKALKGLHWLGHASFRIDAGVGAIYIDPYEIKDNNPKAALILITHDHYDHYSPKDLAKIMTPETIVCAPSSVTGQMEHGRLNTMAIGDSISPMAGVEVKAMAAYNLNKEFHPKSNHWLGFLLKVGGVTYYHPGDSDFIPEMLKVETDIAFLPVSGTYVMTAEEAAKAALSIKPRVAVPMHYGSLVGSRDDAVSFAGSLEGMVNVKIMERE